MKPDSIASQQMIRFLLDVSNSPKEIEQPIVAVQGCVYALHGEEEIGMMEVLMAFAIIKCYGVSHVSGN